MWSMCRLAASRAAIIDGVLRLRARVASQWHIGVFIDRLRNARTWPHFVTALCEIGRCPPVSW